MPRFIAVHTMPMTEEMGQAVIEQRRANPLPPGIDNDYAWVDFSAGKIFCQWLAPSREAVVEALKVMQMPYDEIYPVRRLDWAKFDLEPAP